LIPRLLFKATGYCVFAGINQIPTVGKVVVSPDDMSSLKETRTVERNRSDKKTDTQHSKMRFKMESCIGLMTWAVLYVCISQCGYCVVARDTGLEQDQDFKNSEDLDWDQQAYQGIRYFHIWG
jgi:ferredoxin